MGAFGKNSARSGAVTPHHACFETVRLDYGRPQHLVWHQRRVEATFRDCFGCSVIPDLSQILETVPAEIACLPIARCRIDYDPSGRIETLFAPYTPRPIRRIAWVESAIVYPYKFADRTALDALQKSAPQADAVVITQDGWLRDTTTANIALRQKGIWYIPEKPLLPGTTLARLLAEGFLQLRPIHREEIGAYDGLALMNAMIGFMEVEVLSGKNKIGYL